MVTNNDINNDYNNDNHSNSNDNLKGLAQELHCSCILKAPASSNEKLLFHTTRHSAFKDILKFPNFAILPFYHIVK